MYNFVLKVPSLESNPWHFSILSLLPLPTQLARLHPVVGGLTLSSTGLIHTSYFYNREKYCYFQNLASDWSGSHALHPRFTSFCYHAIARANTRV